MAILMHFFSDDDSDSEPYSVVAERQLADARSRVINTVVHGHSSSLAGIDSILFCTVSGLITRAIFDDCMKKLTH